MFGLVGRGRGVSAHTKGRAFYLEHTKDCSPFKMKGIVVFDDRSDLAFYSLDKEMERYVKERVKQLEGEAVATSVSAAHEIP